MNIAAWVLVSIFVLRSVDDIAKLYAQRYATPERMDALVRLAKRNAYVVGHIGSSVLICVGSILVLLRAVGVL